MDEEVELMDVPAREMEARLNEVIANTDSNKEVMNQIHAYMFIYDSSNKRTFDSMKCMLETIVELEKSLKKSAGTKGGGGKKKGKGGAGEYYPKKIIVGNKKDLRKNKEAGHICAADIENLDGIKIKEISALTN